MSTVYDHFIDFAESIKANSKNVEKGINYYLTEIGLQDYCGTDLKRVVDRELTRFKLMKPQTFINFFYKYEIRSKIIELKSECDELAIERAIKGKLLTEIEHKNTIGMLYNAAAEIVEDECYKSWLDEVLEDAKGSLDYASGNTNMISRRVAEKLKYLAANK